MRRRSAILAWLMAVALPAATLTGCSPTNPTAAQPIVVLAAAALKPSFTRIAAQFEAENPDASIRFDFASSPDLATQLLNGATADVFASADTAQMDRVDRAGLLTAERADFATNTLVIVTAPGNPKHFASFSDLAEPGVAVVVSPAPMPCGVATERVAASTGVTLHPISAEPDVEDVLNKVITGEADAGLVNVTDAAVAGDRVTTVSIPEAAEAVSTYPIAVLAHAARPGPATRFVAFVAGGPGRAILEQAGFGTP
ncbi:molybdate ABC transporter substrate-binding protein [Mycobacterium sp. M1]|uniref:Molybdate ABC transporter substrate-binding protein n=1 Tax=Mycolicibacter acidiphilus TaxID=2835306 RepID=A0ABS5RJX7_9MYCO|nr:molybdate ABC transporter substrate-binding protein [Mycolicibacter acidiphilus]MBS9534551.1 molybdate ABC transporter substrate-binding protein [Mycolicibacter acidiphilus]